MDPAAMISLGLSGANFLLTWGLGFYMHIVSKNKVTNDRITKLESDFDLRMDGQGERIAALEMQLKVAPTHEDLGKLHEKVNRVAESSSRIEGLLEGVAGSVRAIQGEITKRGLS